MRIKQDFEEIPMNVTLRYNGQLHKQVNDKHINVGDTLICLQNNCIGICDEIIGSYVVIKESWKKDWTTEISKVRQLVMI